MAAKISRLKASNQKRNCVPMIFVILLRLCTSKGYRFIDKSLDVYIELRDDYRLYIHIIDVLL